MTATFQPAASTSAQTLTTDQVLQQLQALLQPLGAVAEVEAVALPDACRLLNHEPVTLASSATSGCLRRRRSARADAATKPQRRLIAGICY